MKKICFTIPIPPITKKNHSQIVTRGAKKFLVPSKQYQQYETDAGWYIPCRGAGIDCPLAIKYLFYLPTRKKTDLTNLEEAIDDILVHYNVITDDNYTIIASHDGSRVFYDKENPRTEVTIEPYVETKSEPTSEQEDGCEYCNATDIPCANCEELSYCHNPCKRILIYDAAKAKEGYCSNCGRKL